MNEYLLLKFLHLIAFVYWLGGDLGTFLASREVVNAQHSPQTRQIALKIMLACDMGPKLAMPLILPLGIHLAASGGWLPLPPAALVLFWVLGIYWFSMVLILFLNEGKPFTGWLMRVDFWFRVSVALLLAGWAIVALLGSASMADWVAWKVLVFAAMVGCGILIRINLKSFVPAFTELMTQGASDAVNNTMQAAISRCRPWVWCIWAGLFVNAALGIHLLP